MLLDGDPALGALRVGTPIGWPNFPEGRRLFPDIGNFDARDEVGDLLVRNVSCASSNHQASKSLRTPRRIIQGSDTPPGDAEQVDPGELEMIREQIKIASDAPRLRSARRIGQALAPA